MENIKKLIFDAVETTYENIIKNDSEYIKLEKEKNEIINSFKLKFAAEEYQELEKLIDCYEGQNFITAMAFCQVRALDLDNMLAENN